MNMEKPFEKALEEYSKRNRRFGGNCDVEHLVMLAMYHDCSEILTGDMPTPIKYYNPAITKAYKDVEKVAEET